LPDTFKDQTVALYANTSEVGMMCGTVDNRILKRRGTPMVCQYSGKKWVLHENTSVFWCLMRCGVLNLSEGYLNRDVVMVL